jgi:PAS domain S-box-containing protein
MALYAWRAQRAVYALSLGGACLAVCLWAFVSGLQINSTHWATSATLVYIQIIGIALLPVMWLLFALQSTGRGHWLTPPNLVLLFALPTITIALSLTNDVHHLMFGEVAVVSFGDMRTTVADNGLWFTIHSMYSYALLALGNLFLLLRAWTARSRDRIKLLLTLFAVFIPWIVNALYLARVFPYPLDLTPFAFSLSLLILGWDIYRYGLLDLMPIAFQRVVDEMPDAVLVLDASHKIVHVNRATAALMGKTSEALFGQDLLVAFPAYRELIEQAHGWADGAHEFKREHPDKPLRWLEIHLTTLHGQFGQPIGKVVVLRDVTAQKQEAERLLQDRDKAMETNHFKTDLLRKISHDIRTPLSTIRLNSSAILDARYGTMPEGAAQALRRIDDTAQFVDNMLRQLLDQAKLDARKLTLNNTEFELATLVKHITTLQVNAEQKGLRFELSVDKRLPAILIGDSERLQQIIQNLTINAIKFTSAGCVSVRLLRTSASAWGIEVQDTGIGIPRDKHATIFEAYTQTAGGATDAEKQGYGLGLSIVKDLVTLMSGKISLTSAPGDGTTFRVDLPFLYGA